MGAQTILFNALNPIYETKSFFFGIPDLRRLIYIDMYVNYRHTEYVTNSLQK